MSEMSSSGDQDGLTTDTNKRRPSPNREVYASGDGESAHAFAVKKRRENDDLEKIIGSSASRILQLRFVSPFPGELTTFTNIRDHEGASVKVALHDSLGSIVKDGPESSATIEISVLRGDFKFEDRDDWSALDLDRYVLRPQEGRGPLLLGNRNIFMREGVAELGELSFTDSSSWALSGMFRLRAKAVKGLPHGVYARDAMSAPIKVKQGHLLRPAQRSLDSKTRCLRHIGPTLSKKLADAKIDSVRDFLQLYHTDANALQKILELSERKWSQLARDAESCSFKDYGYLYNDEESGVALMLDCVFNIHGVIMFNGPTRELHHLTDSEKELVRKVRRIAFEKRKDLPRIDIETKQIFMSAKAVPLSVIPDTRDLDTTMEDIETMLTMPPNSEDEADLNTTMEDIETMLTTLPNSEVENFASDTSDSTYVLHAEELLDGLEPHKAVRTLTIKNYQGTSFPHCIKNPEFQTLATLHLSDCIHPISLPALGQLPSLEHLSIKFFSKLDTVGPEFYGEASSYITPFQALRVLRFEGLLRWKTWFVGEFQGSTFPSLQELHLIDCPWLAKTLPINLHTLKKLEILDCEELDVELPQMPLICNLKLRNCDRMDLSRLGNLSSVESLELSFDRVNKTIFTDLQGLTSLLDLTLNSCNATELQLPSRLQTLTITNSSSYDDDASEAYVLLFRYIPSVIMSLTIGHFKGLDLPLQTYMSLQRLHIHDCCFFKPSCFPLSHFPALEHLEMKNCSQLASFEIRLPNNLPVLNALYVDGCPDFFGLPREGFSAPNLTTLSITKCKNLFTLPERMNHELPSLQTLIIKDCPGIGSFPKAGLPQSLHTLIVANCPGLASRWKQWKIHELIHLRQLEIQGFKDVECFPPKDWLPTGLESLSISHFADLVCLTGEEFDRFNSLSKLKLMYCPNLEFLPENRLPRSLESLEIWSCPFLEQRCQRNIGEYWAKISHIPHIIM